LARLSLYFALASNLN